MKDTVLHLASNRIKTTGVRNEERDSGGGLGDVLQGVEVLIEEEQRHDVIVGESGNTLTEHFDGRLETGNDGFTLLSETNTGETLGFGIGFGGLDDGDLLGFGLVGHGVLHTLVSLDGVHGVCDLLADIKINDEDVDDIITVFIHGGVNLFLDLQGDLTTHQENLIEVKLGNVATDGVVDVGLDLIAGVLEGVEGLFDGLGEDLVLDAELDGDEDVVLGLGLDTDIDFKETHGELSSDLITARDETVETGVSGLVELATRFDDTDFGLFDSSTAAAAHCF